MSNRSQVFRSGIWAVFVLALGLRLAVGGSLAIWPALLGALTCVLVCWLGRLLFQAPAVGLAAGAAAALYGPLIHATAVGNGPSLAAFMALLSLLVLALVWRRPGAWKFLGAGALCGVSGGQAPAVLMFAGMVPLAALGDFRHRYGLAWSAVFVLGVVLGAATAPPGEEMADAFYRGNHPQGKTGGIPPDGAVAQTLEWASAHATEFFRGLAGKASRFWRGEEGEALYAARQQTPLLQALVWRRGLAFPFGLVAPLALWGWLWSVRRMGMTLPAMFAMSYFMGLVPFEVSPQTRLPVVPVLLVFAAYGGYLLCLWARQRRWRLLAPGLVVCALFGALANDF